MEAWGSLVTRVAEEQVDVALAAGTSDLVETVFGPFTGRVIATIVGVPPEDYPQFVWWSEAMADALNLAASGADVRAETLEAVARPPELSDGALRRPPEVPLRRRSRFATHGREGRGSPH